MTDTLLPPALRRAMELLADPPANPDFSNGYLDLLGDQADLPRNTGPIQAAWASRGGSMLYDKGQALTRKMISEWRHLIDWLAIPQGGVALDVGCGPGDITSKLAHAAGPDGLALGVDISGPMLERAVRAEAGPQTGFLLADAQRLPFRDQTIDGVISLAALQLMPDPQAALAEIGRVMRPGARLALMVPTVGRARFWRMVPKVGAHVFGEDEIGDFLEDRGFTGVRTKKVGFIQWLRATRPTA